MTTVADKDFMQDPNVALCMMQTVIHNTGFKEATKSKATMLAWLQEYRNVIDDAISAVKAVNEVSA